MNSKWSIRRFDIVEALKQQNKFDLEALYHDYPEYGQAHKNLFQ